ncbi:hypothetical protein [Hydrogenophaga sp.]|uniref:TapB family protein n=1 Tax=Hydrogenophaga sp. TaxID=1904254 RepID=UPI002C5D00BB|nr:hypothetical protein [Hydrogenophaga sp.]HMP11075.1 hypothetical protein [Hydrogenophaga sp.]
MLFRQLFVGFLAWPMLVLAQSDGSTRPIFKVGDVTVYAINNRGDNTQSEETVTVVSVEEGLIKTKHVRPDRNPPELEGVFNLDLNSLVSGTSGAKFEPALEFYRFPLKVGDAWKARNEVVSLTGARSRSVLDVKVAAQEKVTTPGGEFDAFRIEVSGWINGVSWQGALRLTQTVWYAPAIGRMVKSDYKDFRNSSLNNSTLTELKSHKPAS